MEIGCDERHVPVSDEKVLKLLSQNPHINMISAVGVAVKQRGEVEILWSNGSPSRTLRFPTRYEKDIY